VVKNAENKKRIAGQFAVKNQTETFFRTIKLSKEITV
jgi:hypothetical protein